MYVSFCFTFNSLDFSGESMSHIFDVFFPHLLFTRKMYFSVRAAVLSESGGGTEEQTGGSRAAGGRDETVGLLFGSDQEGQDQERGHQKSGACLMFWR